MPLLISPIDGSPMRQINRHGIEIDVCPTSGGVWLDRGELEKLLTMIQDASNEHYPPMKNAKTHSYPLGRDHDDDDDDDRYKYGRHYDKYKKSKMAKVLDIFDF